MTGLLIVRANVADPADRPLFDTWYQNEHVPDAYRSLRPDRAWRAWSRTDPMIHYAFYEFPDTEAAQGALASEAIKLLIQEFDRVWGARVTRTREVVEVVQRFPNSN
jgi:hypothetical protein